MLGNSAGRMGLCALALLLAAQCFCAPDGPKLYRDRCAKCHGKSGEGVKGKYDEELHGDWSLEKLARYIGKTMPDDDPGSMKGPPSEAVARYVYDQFYSGEARARNHPARLELVRLTNRQYVNTIADLLKSFSPADPPVGAERGLHATYRLRAGNGRGEGNSSERTDREVNFNFTTNFAEMGPPGTNAFSASWRGSLLADESGDHEFIIKTPNGARLWVNDDDTPLIDASVASGSMEEHRATVRLIGGRAYPLRLEVSKAAKDKVASIALSWRPPYGAEQIIPARNLATTRSTPTFVVSTRFPADDSSVGYERGVSVSKAWDEASTHAAIEVANYVTKHLDGFAKTRAGDTNRPAKLQSFCSNFVAAAFRRPLTPAQEQLYVEAQFKRSSRNPASAQRPASNTGKKPGANTIGQPSASAPKPEESVKRVVLLALKSPRFLYLGLDNSKPDDYTVASRLSYALWDSIPDSGLLKAAANKGLHSPEQVRKEGERMLKDARARAKLQVFLHQWLQVTRIENVTKDPQLFPGFTPELVADLRTSLDLFLNEVIWSERSDYRRLLLDNELYVNRRLAQFYSLRAPEAANDDFVRITVEPAHRSGVLTHPYLLAGFSYPKSTSPIHRGVFLTRNIVGRALKPPPMAVAFKDADFKPGMTMREKVSELTRPEACQTCHSVINPLGFSLEQFDAVGRFRTNENGRAIDAISDYLTDEGGKVRLSGARDVAEFAVSSEHAQASFIEQLFHQLVKQPLLAYGPGSMEHLRNGFIGDDFNVQRLVVRIAEMASLKGVDPAPVPEQRTSPLRASRE